MLATALVVDDYAENWRTAKRWLEPRGVRTLYAESGERALGLLSTFEINVTLADYYLGKGKMNGIELLCAMKKQEALRSIPVVMTSYENEIAEVGARLGAVGFLNKPLEENLLLLLIFRALNLPIPP